MKKFALLLTAAFSMTLILDSCSVQKRYHRKGFTVNWNNASVNMKKNRKVVHSETIQEDAFVSNTKQKKKLTKNYEMPVSKDMASSSVTVPSIKNTSPSTLEPLMVKNQASNALSVAKEMSKEKEDIKSSKKAAKKIIKAIKKNQKQDAKTDTIIYLLLILLVPFGTTISMYLYEGSWTGRVTTNLLLTLLCGLPGLIHALVVIFGNK